MFVTQGDGVWGPLYHQHLCASLGEQGGKGTVSAHQLCHQLLMSVQVGGLFLNAQTLLKMNTLHQEWVVGKGFFC